MDLRLPDLPSVRHTGVRLHNAVRCAGTIAEPVPLKGGSSSRMHGVLGVVIVVVLFPTSPLRYGDDKRVDLLSLDSKRPCQCVC